MMAYIHVVMFCILFAAVVSPGDAALATDQCEPVDRRPLFLKLYKVGSESFSRAVINSLDNGFDFYNFTHCGTMSNPVDHGMVKKYILGGLKGMRPCNMHNDCGTLVVILRDPMERAMSQLFFYYLSEFSHRFQTMFSKMPDGKLVDQTYRKFLNSSLTTTVEEMKMIVKACQAMPFLDVQMDVYETVFSRGSKSPDRTEIALENLQNEFGCVGIMESMPSMYALYAQMFAKPLEKTCVADMKHGMSNEYKKMFKAAKRPPAEEILQPETYAYMKELLSGEYRLWEKAKEIHAQQLLVNGFDSVIEATSSWNKACPKKYFYDRRSKKIKKNATTTA